MADPRGRLVLLVNGKKGQAYLREDPLGFELRIYKQSEQREIKEIETRHYAIRANAIQDAQDDAMRAVGEIRDDGYSYADVEWKGVRCRSSR